MHALLDLKLKYYTRYKCMYWVELPRICRYSVENFAKMFEPNICTSIGNLTEDKSKKKL